MQPLVTGMRIKQGFTLIELLVVLLIIGITLSFAIVHFGDFGERQTLLFAANQLASNLHLAKQQAILSSSTLKMVVDAEHYQIYQLKPPSQWVSLSTSLFKRHAFPRNTLIQLKTVPAKTFILITPLGEMTPFRLTIGNKSNPMMKVLEGNHQGDLKWIQPR